MSKFGRKTRQPPEGFDYIEPTLTALDNDLRERVNEPHEGLRKNESQWPVHQINWQRSRYVYDMYYTYGRISREIYDYCVELKLVDAALIAKWKKPGYERLCSTYVINPRNYKFGTVSICRVPKQSLAPGTVIEDPMTGCRGCASGPGGEKNIFGNKYGQYLAAIQVAREERQARLDAAAQSSDSDEASASDSDQEDSDSEAELGPVAAADGSAAVKKASVWAAQGDEDEGLELPDEIMGELTGEAAAEGRAAAKNVGRQVDSSGPPGKRTRL